MAAFPREEDIDNELLIEEVEKRPALYEKHLKEYSDINLKRRLWNEIILHLFSTRTLTQEQKENAVTIVQRRWKNLRACFSRELRFQKDMKSGQAAPKRKRYVYFDKLLFLIPSMDQARETSGNAAAIPTHGDNETLDEDGSSSSQQTRTRRTQEKKKKSQSYEESLLNILKENNSCNIQTDPDNHFALSLVPMLKLIPPDKKIDAQIAVLNTLKYYTSSSSSSSNYNTTAASYIIPPIRPPRILSQQIISPPQQQPPRTPSQQIIISRPQAQPLHLTSSQEIQSTSNQALLDYDISSPQSNATVLSFVSNYSADDSDIANFYTSD